MGGCLLWKVPKNTHINGGGDTSTVNNQLVQPTRMGEPHFSTFKIFNCFSLFLCVHERWGHTGTVYSVMQQCFTINTKGLTSPKCIETIEAFGLL